jgi:hypothetical protein
MKSLLGHGDWAYNRIDGLYIISTVLFVGPLMVLIFYFIIPGISKNFVLNLLV